MRSRLEDFAVECREAQGTGKPSPEPPDDLDLRGADLRGSILRGADLTGADLCNVVWGGADLSDADLTDTDLRGTRLHGADAERPGSGTREGR